MSSMQIRSRRSKLLWTESRFGRISLKIVLIISDLKNNLVQFVNISYTILVLSIKNKKKEEKR